MSRALATVIVATNAAIVTTSLEVLRMASLPIRVGRKILEPAIKYKRDHFRGQKGPAGIEKGPVPRRSVLSELGHSRVELRTLLCSGLMLASFDTTGSPSPLRCVRRCGSLSQFP